MTTVTMLMQMSGSRNGAKWPAPGGTVEVSADEAAQLVRLGFGEIDEGGAKLGRPEVAAATADDSTDEDAAATGAGRGKRGARKN